MRHNRVCRRKRRSLSRHSPRSLERSAAPLAQSRPLGQRQRSLRHSRRQPRASPLRSSLGRCSAPMIPLPFFIVGVAVAILIFSLGSVALAASRVPSSARPVRAFAPSTAISPTASTASSAGTPQASPTTIVSPTPTTDPKTTPPPQPTNSPVIAPPPPPPPAKSVAISQLNQPLCTEAQFTITYRTGQGAVSWSVTSPDPTNIGVGLTRDTTDYGQVSGSLTPGATVVIYVEERNDGAFHGALSVAVSAGAPVTFVSYDTGQCTGG